MIFDDKQVKDENSTSKSEDSRGRGMKKRILSFPLPGQCIFCGKQFKNSQERNAHIKEVHD
jgi:hypothetical protein